MAQENVTNGKKNNPKMQGKIDFSWGIKIPMRDGVSLNGTLYKPKDNPPTPAIFTLTPYTMESSHARGLYFSRHSYAFVIVDSRGRGNSEGFFEPFMNEANDGYDITEWLAVQPWCDGQVAMWGGSYCGTDQWLTLREFPPHLKTIVPTASAYAGVDFPCLANIFGSYDIQWLTFTSGVTRNTALMDDSSFWIEKYQEMYENHLPYKDLARITGNESALFQTWTMHPHPDSYWDAMTLTPGQYDAINMPILTITGHYDDDQPGAMEYYRRHMASNSPRKDEHFLILGPWDHPGTRSPSLEFGGLKLAESSLIDMNDLHKEWYDWQLKAGQKPSFLQKRVAYYVMGLNQWRYADNMEAIGASPVKLYLDSDSGANDVFHSGILREILPSGKRIDSFIYDPLDTRFGNLEWTDIKEYLTDQTYDLNLFGNGLVYHTAPFDSDKEITGWIKFYAWIEIDVPDTDFMVTLSEILPNGQAIRLTRDMLRARFRESNRIESLVVPGEINQYKFSGFTFFSKLIPAGNRLRLVISCPNTIYLEKNYNSGGIVAQESGEDAHTALVILHHDQEHPSYLELPIVTKA